MAQLWWLSFCDPAKPSGQQFLGACIVNACCMLDAIREAHSLGCNPGGEAVGHSVPADCQHRVKPHQIGVLLNREQAESFDKELN
ncbi:MAG TPA: hypothetical protein VJN18_32535 [Polyangiaceae bacterium]|nr:hypothetical protein [Polyangiaceae bacterium]